jgi:hypothetical protein
MTLHRQRSSPGPRKSWIRLLVCAWLMLLILSGQPGHPKADSLATVPLDTSDSVVILGDEKLFPIKAKVASFSTEFRAEVISR